MRVLSSFKINKTPRPTGCCEGSQAGAASSQRGGWELLWGRSSLQRQSTTSSSAGPQTPCGPPSPLASHYLPDSSPSSPEKHLAITATCTYFCHCGNLSKGKQWDKRGIATMLFTASTFQSHCCSLKQFQWIRKSSPKANFRKPQSWFCWELPLILCFERKESGKSSTFSCHMYSGTTVNSSGALILPTN